MTEPALRPVAGVDRAPLVGWRIALLALPLALGFGACGPAAYSIRSARATSAVAQAEQANVKVEAPYEWFKAEAYLDKAREEAAAAEYQDAIRLAESAEEYANKAIEIARRKRRGSVR